MKQIESMVGADAVAKFLGVTPRTVRIWQRTKSLPVYRISYRKKRFRLSEIARWVEQQCNKGAQ